MLWLQLCCWCCCCSSRGPLGCKQSLVAAVCICQRSLYQRFPKSLKIAEGLSCTACAGLPASMTREVQSVFPDVDLTGMLIVPTCQQADYDLVRTGEKIDTEKDRLLERVRLGRCTE